MSDDTTKTENTEAKIQELAKEIDYWKNFNKGMEKAKGEIDYVSSNDETHDEDAQQESNDQNEENNELTYENEPYEYNKEFTGTPPVPTLKSTKAVKFYKVVKGSKMSDWFRTGKTVVSNQLVKGKGAKGATVTWGIKGGGKLSKTGESMGFHYHVHKYNWYKPWSWFKNTPIVK